MIAGAFAYAIAVTLLIGLAAASIERFLAELGRPRRLAWLAAYVVAVVFPLVSLLLAEAPPTEVALASSAASAAAPAPIDWDAVLLRLWAAATALLALGYAAAWIRLTLLAKRWPQVANGEAPIVLADDVGPAVLGVFRPCIVLPHWLASAPEVVRNTVVAHELEHIAARDQACIVTAQLVTVLLPWNLPLWWFARRLRLGIELDCDARVLRRGVDAEHYADVLLLVGQRRSPSPYLAAALIEPATQLERRIRIMLTPAKTGAPLRAASAAALALGIAACAARVEPPVMRDTEPSAGATEEPAASSSEPLRLPFLSRMPRREPTAEERQNAAVIYAQDGTPTVVAANRLMKTEDGMVFDGNVKIDFDRTSITATRAVTKRTGDNVTLTLENAVVTYDLSAPGP
jgi:beta-lactamase regulating signal transducer with metallopeptidase domain